MTKHELETLNAFKEENRRLRNENEALRCRLSRHESPLPAVPLCSPLAVFCGEYL